MIDPDLLCSQHIVGEHRELHALKGSLERTKPEYDNCEKHRKNLTTLAKDGLIELKSLKERQEEMVKNLKNHDSPIGKIPTLTHLPNEVVHFAFLVFFRNPLINNSTSIWRKTEKSSHSF